MDDFRDPDIERVLASQVAHGEFATVAEARADFMAKLEESIAQADAGDLHDIDTVFDRLQQRYASWPRAAE